MSNYIKKYNVGNIRVDLPYNSYIHELPLLSFKDFRNSVNISLIFNHKLKIDGNNSFNIKEGFKLNIQKKIIKDSNGKPIKIIDTNGKYVDLISNSNYENGSSVENNLYTFDDESKRVLRVLSSGYEIEYEDLSKEVYNALGNITAKYDKYQDLILTYTYTNNLLTKISYKEKEVIFTYNNNILQTIFYGGTTTTFTITESNLSVSHYSNVTYIMTVSNTSYIVVGSAYENNELFSVSKECVYNGNNITLTSKVGQDIVDSIIYTFPYLVTNGYESYNVINVTNKTGVKQRVHYLGENLLYSYEIKEDNDVEFIDGTCISDINIYNTFNFASNYSFNGIIKYDDGVQLSKESPSSNKYIYDASFYDINDTKGCYLITGWVKTNNSNSSVKLEVENENELGYEFDVPTGEANKWHFFACQCELHNANVVKIFLSNIGAELKDVRVTYQVPYIIEPNKESHSIYKEDVLILEENGIEIKALKDLTFNIPTSDTTILTLTLSDVLRYLRRKVNNKTGEIYYNNGKNVINNISSLEFKVNEKDNFKSIENYSVGYRCYNNGVETYCNIKKMNKGNKVLEIYTYEKHLKESIENLKSIEYLNIYFDSVEAKDYFNVKLNAVDGNEGIIDIGEVTTKFFRDKGLVTKETDEKTYNYEYSYNEPLNKMIFKDELLDGTLHYSIAYYIDSIWGVVYKEEKSGNTDTQITYDSDKSTILQEEFNESNLSVIHKYAYGKGNLTSLSCGDLKYNFEYDKNDLSKVLKFNSQIEEQSHTDFTSTMYYPSFSSPIYSKQYNYDKYQRLTSIEGELVNTYDFGFDNNTGEPLNISSNASSKLIMTEDKLVGEKTRFAYDEKGMVTSKLTSSSTDVSQIISQESFEYDKAKRLKTKQFVYNFSNVLKVEDDITYVNQETDMNIDARVKSINYKINEQNEVNTVYGYVNEETSSDRGDRRLNKKTYTFKNGFKVSKGYGIEYDKINNETLTFNQTLKNTVSYTYDLFNRISSITRDNKTTTYEYDGFGRLVRENNEALDKTIVYTYNDYGNIVSNSTYSFNNLSNLRYTKSYTYDETQKDRVVNFDNTTIAYNSLGCPTTHKGYNLSWSKGKLTKLSQGTLKTGTTRYSYSYNALGQRISKYYTYIPGNLGSIAIGIMTDYSKKYYYDSNGRLIKETSISTYYNNGTVNQEINYLYDANNIVGIKYTKNSNTNTYYFERNILGDVVAIYDTLGNLKVKYLYDAYGNCTVSSETTDSSLASVNPIRYRGYYYDVETGWFWVSSRYYSPELCRFISPDDIEYLDPESINGLNLYAYAKNNPIMYYDPSGHSAILVIGLLVGSFIVGAGASIVSQGLTYGWDEINYWQAGVDGLFALGSTALAMTGIGALASAGIGAVAGWSQYAIGSAFHGEDLTLIGSLTATGLGFIGGAISGAGARNSAKIASSMKLTGKGASAVKAITTASNRYLAGEISMKGLQATTRLWGNVALNAVQDAIAPTIRRLMINGAITIAGVTIGTAAVNYGLSYVY